MMNLNALKIDPEFQGKIPPLNFEEEQQLEQNILHEGRLLNPIIIWNGFILDGHTRYRILRKHPLDTGDRTGQPLRSSLMDLPEPAWTQKSRPGTKEVSDGQAV